MDMDSGCDCSSISKETVHTLWLINNPPIVSCEVRLVDENKQEVEVKGGCFVKVYQRQIASS